LSTYQDSAITDADTTLQGRPQVDVRGMPGNRHRIIYDGLNLALRQGTGITTYTRNLTRVARKIGYEVGVVFGTSFTPKRDAN